MTPPYLVGLDLGQVSDFTALAIAQRRVEQWGNVQEQHYIVRHLERFPLGTPYGGRCLHGIAPKQPCRDCPRGLSIGGIVEQVRVRLLALPLPDAWYRTVPKLAGNLATFPNPAPPYEWLIDYTGVGKGVADMFTTRDTWPICITVTAGNAVIEAERGVWHVAKRQLVSPLQVALQTRRLHVIDNELGRIIQQEGVAFKYRLNKRADGDEQYAAWKTGEHDDLILAVAMLVWWGERTAPLFVGGNDQQQFAISNWHPHDSRKVPI